MTGLTRECGDQQFLIAIPEQNLPHTAQLTKLAKDGGEWQIVRINADAGRLRYERLHGKELPVPFGGPVRVRVPRELGYKNVKYISRVTLTDNLKPFGKGLGGANSDGGYAWYAGI